MKASNDEAVLKIHQDSDLPESPREWNNLGKMICFHSRYALGDEHNYSNPRDFLEGLDGDVYGFVIETLDGEHIDSCWGFYSTNWKENGMAKYMDEKYHNLIDELESVC